MRSWGVVELSGSGRKGRGVECRLIDRIFFECFWKVDGLGSFER